MKINKPFALALVMIAVFAVLFSSVNRVNNLARTAGINSQNIQTIIIDAGHGGFDPGAEANDVVEKDVNLEIALNLRDLLLVMGFEVIMIRDDDISVHDPHATTIRQKKRTDLLNRLEIINSNQHAVFVSIHQNTYPGQSRGAQVFYTPKNDDAKLLADAIQTSIRENLQPENDRVIRKTNNDIYILYNAKIPAVLVECGFLTNPAEAELLTQEEYQQKMAYAILIGILQYL